MVVSGKKEERGSGVGKWRKEEKTTGKREMEVGPPMVVSGKRENGESEAGKRFCS